MFLILQWKPLLDGIQSPLVSSKLVPTLDEAWPVILQALALDAVPSNANGGFRKAIENTSRNSLISNYSMVELELEEYRFLWSFALLVLFQQQYPAINRQIIHLNTANIQYGGDSTFEETNPTTLKLYEIVLPVFQFLSSERFFTAEFLSADICQELLQVLIFICSFCSYSLCIDLFGQ